MFFFVPIFRISISTYILTYTSIDMHGNHHHHHHQRTDLGGIMSITSVFTIEPFVPCVPLCKILNTPVMSIVKQNDVTWVEKHHRFLFNVRFLFFSGTFLHLCDGDTTTSAVQTYAYSCMCVGCCTEGYMVIWATNQLGDNVTGQQPTGRVRHILVNWATTLEG